MAKRKRKKSSARKRRMSATPRRTRRKRARKGGLSEMFSPAVASDTAKTLGMGALGGVGAVVIDRLTPNATPMQKAIYMAVAGFITGSVLRQPKAAAGMAGVAAYKLIQEGGLLSDGNETTWADPIEALPPFIFEENEGLSEGEQYALADDAYALADAMNGGYEYMPEYATSY